MLMKETTVVFPGSFDPPTNGHIDIISRASKLFDRVIVGVGINPDKSYMFNENERLDLLSGCLQEFKNVDIKIFEGLTVEFARQNKASAIVRSLRTEADYAYEKSMASMNYQLAPEIDTIMFEAKSDLFSISSSLIKDIARLGQDVSKFVPQNVSEALK